MPSPFMQDIQEGARRGVNAGWGGTPGEGPTPDEGGTPGEWPTSDEGKRLQEARAG